MSNEISEVTRLAISDFLTISGIEWCGRLTDDDFLARLYDLTALPSSDGRFGNAAGDIFQHRVRNPEDWPTDWVFTDPRFNLLHVPDAEFTRFLSETLHPVVQRNAETVDTLLKAYNQELARDGWQLVEIRKISNRPIFTATKIGLRAEVFTEPTGWQKVDRQLQEARTRLDDATAEEQYQAVGLLCREALISAAQAVFDPERYPTPDGVHASETDAKRMLEAIFETTLKGNVNEEARGHAKAAVRLALALQHKRTADFRMAALCSEATSSVINLLAIIEGKRGRSLA